MSYGSKGNEVRMWEAFDQDSGMEMNKNKGNIISAYTKTDGKKTPKGSHVPNRRS